MAKLSVDGGKSTTKRRRDSSEEEEDDQSSQTDEEEEEWNDDVEEEGNGEEEEDDQSAQNDDVEERTSGVGPNRKGSVSLTLTALELLDCNICFEPLTVPIFQCKNGHIACSSCCTKIGQKCSLCPMYMGDSRCRTLEKVLESLKAQCQYYIYGCKQMVAYVKKSDHEKICAYQPCECPITDCNFRGATLSLHVKTKHPGATISFSFDSTIPIFLNKEIRFLVLYEEKEGVIFIVNNKVQHNGNEIAIFCMESPSVRRRYFYEVSITSGGLQGQLKFRSYTKNIKCKFDNFNSLSEGFLPVPLGFFDIQGKFTIELRIWRSGTLTRNT